MEKGSENRKDTILRKIVLTGPESTGKTTLAERLAGYYNTIWVPEYAREYVRNLRRPYTYGDVIHIAQKQIEQLGTNYTKAHDYVFFDTGLIITKVWFAEVYQKFPDFLEKAIRKIHIDLYVLCSPDLPWRKDPIRENRGRNRKRLFTMYRNELETYGFKYEIVRGKGNARINNALKCLERLSERN
ncbi:MAG: ATP-binding protein [Bacteroidales bacterium]|nr:MAG: ATP-binding protein [Bacteroidales bacterium]